MEVILAHLHRFFHQTLGPKSGPKIVFLHGLLGFSANWRRIAATLSDSYHILLFDQRGHGRSEHFPEGYSLSQFAEDLALILDDLGWQEVNVVGHSLGGRVALRFASRWPQRITKLVIEDIGPEIHEASSLRVESWLRGIPAPFADRASAEQFFGSVFLDLVGDRRQALALSSFFLANMHQASSGRFDWRVDLAGLLAALKGVRAESQWSEWRQLACPVLVVRGEHSQDLPRPTFDDMLKGNRLAQGVEVKGSGHWVHFDQPEVFTQVVSEFLRL